MNVHSAPQGATRVRRQLLRAAAACVLAAGATAAVAQAVEPVSLETARADLEAGRAQLIDIREPDEHALGVARGATLLPMRQLATRLGEIPTDRRKPVYLICNTQNRSHAVWRALRERGYSHVHYVAGGMSEWNRRGWPVVRPGS